MAVKSKHSTKKVIIDDLTFESKSKAGYYENLKQIQENDQILFFRTQPRYLLQEAFTKNGVLYEQIEYAADFEVHHKDGSIEVIDIKGAETEAFKIKRKLFEKKYPHILSLFTYNPDDEEESREPAK
ncbi:DUF1064 domain-containing protein [Pseudobacillus badius]|uniref:DUF1064 domain-containing protein n=1 Tax=Bacillus badius TaxID=1455 RepID=UPI0007B38593|nr:DUF1064 domain-containing protein [Bacillus badius]KZR60020.1 hypothetical protein A3781_07395 [Bacillus badius]